MFKTINLSHLQSNLIFIICIMFYEPALCAKADDSFCKIHVQFNDNVSPIVILAKPFMDDHCIKRN